jgi:hypothetical protein
MAILISSRMSGSGNGRELKEIVKPVAQRVTPETAHRQERISSKR